MLLVVSIACYIPARLGVSPDIAPAQKRVTLPPTFTVARWRAVNESHHGCGNRQPPMRDIDTSSAPRFAPQRGSVDGCLQLRDQLRNARLQLVVSHLVVMRRVVRTFADFPEH
jgi:hypothetical protein